MHKNKNMSLNLFLLIIIIKLKYLLITLREKINNELQSTQIKRILERKDKISDTKKITKKINIWITL